MKRNLIITILLLIFSIFAFGCAKQEANQVGEKPTILIALDPYTSSWPSAYVYKHIAEELGYSTEFVEGDIGFIYLGLAQGDIDIQPAAWVPTLHGSYIKKYKDKVELTGTIYEKPDMGWTVPTYVDIDTIAELKGRADEFDHKIVGIEPSTGVMMTSEKTIESYGLDDYDLVEGSTAGMLAEVERAISKKEPIVFIGWRPHTMFSRYNIKVLKDTKGIWELDNVKTAVHKSFKEKAPDLYNFSQNFNISIEDIEKMQKQMEENNKDINILTKDWIEKNRTKIDEMLGK